jgi:hypothetical protein
LIILEFGVGASVNYAIVEPAHFHRNPSGRSQLAVFLRCSLGPYDSDIGARSRLEKTAN